MRLMMIYPYKQVFIFCEKRGSFFSFFLFFIPSFPFPSTQLESIESIFRIEFCVPVI